MIMADYRILVVDDDPEVRAIVANTLRTKYEVVEAIDGVDAMKKLENAEPDFAIVDSVMPLMDGFQLCREIRNHRTFRAIPVIFLSAYDSREDIQKGYASGGNLYLTKPIDPLRVLKNVDFTIEHEQLPKRKKRYTLRELEKLEEEEQRRARETPPPKPEPAPAEPEYRSPKPAPVRPTPEPEPEPRAEAAPKIEEVAEEEYEVDEGEIEYEYEEDDEYEDEEGEDEEYEEEDEAEEKSPVEAESEEPLYARIMIVDSDDDSRELMEEALHQHYELISSRDGLEALEKIAPYQPDIIILEIMMPRLNGFQFIQFVRNRPQLKHLPIIVVSHKASERDQRYVMRLGATEFLAKPFESKDLAACVRKIVESSDFEIAHKKMTIEEVVETEFLKIKDRTDLASQRERQHKYADLREVLKKEATERRSHS